MAPLLHVVLLIKDATVHNLMLLTLFGNIHAHIRHTSVAHVN
jgi:hypothetical protein